MQEGWHLIRRRVIFDVLPERGSNLGRDHRSVSPPKRPVRLWGPSSLVFNGYRGSFPGVKRPQREVDHSSPSSAVVRNEWSYTSAPPICLHGMDMDNSTFNPFTWK
jgi:hypothetical protein